MSDCHKHDCAVAVNGRHDCSCGIDFFMATCERCGEAIPIGEVVPISIHNYCLDCTEDMQAELDERQERETFHE